jgi:NAD-dependent deacetylase
MKKLVVFTGAGMSADSGLSTFRDSDGLWMNRRVEDICTPEALVHNRADVIDFYNQRRRDALAAKPNAGHYAVAELEKYFETYVITQNVDDLHERAGSKHILHLHGELTKCRSMIHTDKIYDMPERGLTYGEKGPDGTLLRPHIVFFNEAVPNIEPAI